jgi:hypothetical protein
MRANDRTTVIPAKAGIQPVVGRAQTLDPGLRRDDEQDGAQNQRAA